MSLRDQLIERLAAQEAVPATVPALNFELALIADGLLDEVNAFMNTMPQEAQTAWRRATVIEADSPLLAAVAQGIGKTRSDLIALMVKARNIRTS